MDKLTRSKVAYNLEISPHRYRVHGLEYVFSSELYMNKFIEKRGENQEKINESLSKRFGFNILLPILADLKLYNTIEKRGFLIIMNGDKIRCPSDIILDGNSLIMKT